jgi:hypothetical protein
MDAKSETLTPAAVLARENPVRIPNESAGYRAARTVPWPRRSNCGATSSAWRPSAALCRRVAR